MTAAPEHEDDNPFAPPDAVIGDRLAAFEIETEADAELVRRFHLAHESSIRSMGLLGYLGAAFGMLFALVTLLAAVSPIPPGAIPPGSSEPLIRLFMWAGLVFYGGLSVVSFVLGFGLRRLQVWSRWTAIVLLVLSTLYSLLVGGFLALFLGGRGALPLSIGVALGVAIQGYLFYLLVAPKSGMVFSGEYRLVILKTPEIRSRAGLLLRIGLGLMVGLFVLALISVLANSGNIW